MVFPGRKRYAKLDRYLHHFTTRALHALYFKRTRETHAYIMFSFSAAVNSSTALFSASSTKGKKTNAKRVVVSMATVDGEEKKSAKKEMPDRGFWSALAPDGEKSADDYNRWKAELMEKKRKAQEEAAKKPKKFLGLF